MRHFGTREGLPSLSVRDVLKDRAGMLWVATDAGLARWDGRQMEVLTVYDGLPGERVWALAEGEKEHLWIGCYGSGLALWDGQRMQSFNTGRGLPDLRVRCLHYSSRHRLLLVGTENGLGILRYGVFITLPGSAVAPEDIQVITGFHEGDDRIIITSYHSGVYHYFPLEGKIIHYDWHTGLFRKSSSSAFITRAGYTLLSHGRRGLYALSRWGSSKEGDTSIGQVFSMDQDLEGRVWVAAWSHDMLERGGIYTWENGRALPLGPGLGIQSERCWKVYCEQVQDIVWVATLDQGLYQLLPPVIEHHSNPDAEGRTDGILSLLADSRSRLWIGGKSLLKVRLPGGDSRPIRMDGPVLEARKSLRKAVEQEEGATWDNAWEAYFRDGLGQFRDIREDARGRIWVSFDIGGLRIWPTGKTEFIFRMDKLRFDFLGPELIVYGNWNNFGISKVPEGQNLRDGVHWPPVPPWPRNNITDVLRIGDALWVASSTEGLFRYGPEQGWHYKTNDGQLHRHICCLCAGPGGRVISGDQAGRITVHRLDGDSLVPEARLGQEQGIHGQSIHWLLYDPAGFLWAGTNLGVHCIAYRDDEDLRDPRLRFLDAEEGLRVVSGRSAALGQDGRLWVGGDEGLDAIQTGQVYEERRPRLPLLPRSAEVDFRPNTRVIVREKGGEGWSLHLPFRAHQVRISFSLPNTLDPHKDRFRYCLLGTDTLWSAWRTEAIVDLGGLSPGHFTLLIEHSAGGSLHALTQYAFPVIVPTPWYLTTWARAGFFGLFIALLVTIYRLARWRALRKARRAARLKERMAELEVKALQAQMNPHFIFNSINGIQAYILSGRTEEAIAYLGDFSRVVRDSLENVNQRLIPLSDAIGFLESYLRLESMRFPGRFSWEIILASGLDACTTLIPPMIIQPYAENALVHGFRTLGKEGRLRISIFRDPSEAILCVEVEDNGIGLERSRRLKATRIKDGEGRRSHSGDITARRIRMMNPPGHERFGVSIGAAFPEATDPGCRVCLRLPLQQL